MKISIWEIIKKKGSRRSMNNLEKREKTLAYDIQDALKKDEFKIYLQPLISVDNERIDGFEALLRWQHPVKGVLEPTEFMPLIKTPSVKEQLDYMVFEKVCAFLQHRLQDGKKMFCISCNFVREHFMKFDFVTDIQKIREKYQVPARYLALEIMEGQAFAYEGIVQRNVEELNRLGYPVYLDDCGAENSTISDLMFHSITHIKIDKKIIDQIDRENVQVLLHGLCSIAHRLSCKTVCEGVETREQLELAKRCGVDTIQGFYFYHPMNVANAEILFDAYA